MCLLVYTCTALNKFLFEANNTSIKRQQPGQSGMSFIFSLSLSPSLRSRDSGNRGLVNCSKFRKYRLLFSITAITTSPLLVKLYPIHSSMGKTSYIVNFFQFFLFLFFAFLLHHHFSSLLINSFYGIGFLKPTVLFY